MLLAACCSQQPFIPPPSLLAPTPPDVASEKAILEAIQAAFPNHAVLGEEGGVSGEMGGGLMLRGSCSGMGWMGRAAVEAARVPDLDHNSLPLGRRHQQRVPVVRGPAGRHHQLCARLPLFCRVGGGAAPHHARGLHGCAWEAQAGRT